MPAEKGNTYGQGRPKGSKNVKTEQWEIFAEWFLNQGMNRLQTEMGALEGKEFVTTVKDLLEYFKPKLARTEIDGKVDMSLNINRKTHGDRLAAQLHSEDLPGASVELH